MPFCHQNVTKKRFGSEKMCQTSPEKCQTLPEKVANFDELVTNLTKKSNQPRQ